MDKIMNNQYLYARNSIFDYFDDLDDNPIARIATVLTLDISISMHGDPIRELNRGLRTLYKEILEDEMARYSAEISIVTFGKGGARQRSEFKTLQEGDVPPELDTDGRTPLGEAVNLSLDLLEKRKNEYRSYGIDYYQPWMVLMTDGSSNGDPDELSRAIERTRTLVNQNKLTVIPVGIGPRADMELLKKFSPKYPPMRLQDLKFSEFFRWVSQSVSRIGEYSIDEIMKGITGWNKLE